MSDNLKHTGVFHKVTSSNNKLLPQELTKKYVRIVLIAFHLGKKKIKPVPLTKKKNTNDKYTLDIGSKLLVCQHL